MGATTDLDRSSWLARTLARRRPDKHSQDWQTPGCHWHDHTPDDDVRERRHCKLAAMSVVVVAGARPNFVKVAPLLHASRGRLAVDLVHTGQHYDRSMSGVFFDQLGIPAADENLGIPGAQTAQTMAAFDVYLARRAQPPRGVVVVGDVSSTMACALAAVARRIPVAHVEAGLRSFDRTMPEEMYRIVTDGVSDLLFASESAAIENLAREGRADARLVGNVMIDTLVKQLPAIRNLEMAKRFAATDYIVVTLHRPSNVDDPMQLALLCEVLAQLATERPVIFPVHPRTRGRLGEVPGVQLIEPLGYREFLGLVSTARCVVTDSGGLQEETTYLGIPCFTLRTNTERPSTITLGTNQLVSDITELPALVKGATRRAPPVIEGWDGHAAERIVETLAREWG